MSEAVRAAQGSTRLPAVVSDVGLRRHIPNALTALRLLIAAAFFVLLALWTYPATELVVRPTHPVWPYLTAAALFGLAALTDAIDGPLARRWNVVSPFGRVMDPVADKVLVLGAFIMLAGPNFSFDAAAVGLGQKLSVLERAGFNLQRGLADLFTPGRLPKPAFPMRDLQVSGVVPWMVVVMLSREILVTSIRALLEAQGKSFPAVASGKLKMIFQACAVPAILVLLGVTGVQRGTWGRTAIDVIVWTTVIVTVISGVPYLVQGLKLLSERRSDNPPGARPRG
jgi:phosphatidylglycerophosphate synthase